MAAASQQATPSIVVKDSILDATNVRGRLLTTQRQNKVASSSKSTCDERNFGDSSYEVKERHEDPMKPENKIKKELKVLKQQLKEEQKMHRQENELQQEQEQQGAQHAFTDETAPVEVIDPSQRLARSRQGQQCC